MRTLKKTLALVLVLAMMFSLCVTVSAADFADQEEIKNEMAVNTLAAYGYIEGMPDGTFDPEGTLTRAQAATILCRMLGLDAYIEQCATPFTDVAESHWASGYIAYCADAGIIAGYGDGKFGPSDVLTGYAWAKMLIVAYGMNVFGETVIDLTGAAWQINTAKLAVANHIWDGDDSSKKAACTRDNACLHAYNVLPPAMKATAEEIADEFGVPVSTDWSVTVGEEKVVVLSVPAAEPVLTYTKGVATDKILEDLDLEEATFAYVVDGVAAEEYTADDSSIVKVYAGEDEGEYDVYDINVYVAEVSSFVEANEDNELEASYAVIDGENYETEELAEGDVVLYTKNAEDFVEVVKAEATQAAISAVGANYVVVGGEKLGFAAQFLGDEALVKATKTEIIIYTDMNGAIVALANVPAEDGEEPEQPEEPEVVYYYGIMLDSAWQPYTAGTQAGLLGGGSAAVEAAEKFEIYTAAGEVVVYDGVITYDEETEVYSGVLQQNGAEGLVKYALEEGKVSELEIVALEAVEEAYVAGAATLADNYLDAATIAFVIGEEDIAVYTGYQAIPAFEKARGGVVTEGTWAVLVVDEADLTEEEPEEEEPEDPTASVGFVADAAYYVTFATVGEGEEEEEIDVYVYEGVYVDGAKTTIYALAELDVTAGGLYNLSTDEDGYTTVTSAVDAVNANVTRVAATYFVAGSVYYTTDATAYYVIDDGIVAAEGISASTEEETVAAAYVLIKDGKVEAVYYTVTAVEAE